MREKSLSARDLLLAYYQLRCRKKGIAWHRPPPKRYEKVLLSIMFHVLQIQLIDGVLECLEII